MQDFLGVYLRSSFVVGRRTACLPAGFAPWLAAAIVLATFGFANSARAQSWMATGSLRQAPARSRAALRYGQHGRLPGNLRSESSSALNVELPRPGPRHGRASEMRTIPDAVLPRLPAFLPVESSASGRLPTSPAKNAEGFQCATQESNLRPTAPEAVALSS
jgi:hypothetical protein